MSRAGAWLWLLLFLLWLWSQGCAGVPNGDGFYSCDAVAGGDFDTQKPASLDREELNRMVRISLDAATLTTDPRLRDPVENCRKFWGYRVYTKPTENFMAPWDDKFEIGGFTSCTTRIVVVGTPPSGNWNNSALVHEFFHVMQVCEGIPPKDTYSPPDHHENWYRDGLFAAIEWSRKQP